MSLSTDLTFCFKKSSVGFYMFISSFNFSMVPTLNIFYTKAGSFAVIFYNTTIRSESCGLFLTEASNTSNIVKLDVIA